MSAPADASDGAAASPATSVVTSADTSSSASSSAAAAAAAASPSSSPSGSAAAANKRGSKIDPFAYLQNYHTDTYEWNKRLGDVPIQEPTYTAAEIALMEQLRTAVAAMVSNPASLTATSDDYPAGMWQHWTTYWPEGKSTPYFEDKYRLSDSDSTKWPQHELIRFLRARDMNLNKAIKMYFHYKRWRIIYGATHISSFPTAPFEPVIQSILSHSYHKIDKHGRPLYIQKSGQIDPIRFTKECTTEQIAIGHTWFTEEINKRCIIGSKITGHRVTSIVNIIDVKGLGLSSRKMLKFFSATSYIDQNFHPEMLGCLYLINAPSFFPVVYSICKGFLSPATQRKVKILGTNYQKILIEDLGAECLPKEYGGLCECVGGCCPVPTGAAGLKKLRGEDEEETFLIKAGTSVDLSIPVYPPIDEVEQESYWEYEIAAKDVEVTITFQPTAVSNTNSTTDNEDSSTSTSTSTSTSVSSSSSSSTSSSSASSPAPSPSSLSSPTSSPLPPPVQILQPLTRVSASKQPYTGVYSSSQPGVININFSNAYSRWNSKTVKVRSGTRDKTTTSNATNNATTTEQSSSN